MKMMYNTLEELMSSCSSSELIKQIKMGGGDRGMTNEEIALQLTLKALECGRIGYHRLRDMQIGEPDKISCYNMKLVCDAYKSALKELTSAEG